jgi:hypothetical protein
LQKITLTAYNLCQLTEIRNQELVQNHYGEKHQGDLFELTNNAPSKKNNLSMQTNYINTLLNCLATSASLKHLIGCELGASYSIILDRMWKDATDPKKQGKKKAGFKLGEGSNQVIESVFFDKTIEESLGEIPNGAEMQPSNLEKSFPIELCKFQWWSVSKQEIITSIFNIIVSETRKPKVAKGVRDSDPITMCIKNKVFNFIKETYRKHGAVEIDTPIFELKETLMGKYGDEGAKLIYDLKDQGGELLSLRYDLTVPFARYCALNNVTKMKRFHIGKVYRRDQPNFNKGRYREFHQCDIDLAGPSGTMIADSEILSIVNEIMTGFKIPNFKIKVSDRRLLAAIIEVSGANMDRFAAICSSIDKLDKQPWSEVAVELIEEKGVPADVVDKIGPIVQHKGN